MVKLSWAANRDALIMRNGSSINVGVGSSRCFNNPFFEIIQPIKWIDQFSIIIFVQTDRQRIDGKIAAVLVIFDSTGLHRAFGN